MKNTILTIAGAALIALSSVQFAAAAEQNHKAHHRANEFRNSNAFVAPANEAVSADAYRASGGWSAPAGR
jgi:hypothetical protein